MLDFFLQRAHGEHQNLFPFRRLARFEDLKKIIDYLSLKLRHGESIGSYCNFCRKNRRH